MARPNKKRKASLVIHRPITISGRKSSVALEDAFWNALKEIAATKGVSASQLVSVIDQEGPHINLSSAVRLFVFNYYYRRR
jgi:predicted DNA-binding ribbon-helix-helix protein